jgi:hypothetical protein
MSASPSASSSNPYATVNGISGVYLPLAGGTMTGDIGVNYNDLNQVTSIVFADSTVQTTASTVGTGVLLSSNNLSDLSNASTARTNLGLDYATDAEVLAGTSTSVVLNPSNAQQLLEINHQASYPLSTFNWTAVTAGTGGSTYQLFAPNKEVSVTTAIGSALLYANLYVGSRGRTVSQGIDWSKKNSFSIRIGRNNTPATNTIFRCFLSQKSMATKDLDARGIGFTINGNGNVTIQVHNGTTLNTASTSFASVNSFIDVKIESDGAGTTTCFVNGTSVGTCTGSPTTNTSNVANFNIELQNTSVQSASQIYYSSFAKIDIA